MTLVTYSCTAFGGNRAVVFYFNSLICKTNVLPAEYSMPSRSAAALPHLAVPATKPGPFPMAG